MYDILPKIIKYLSDNNCDYVSIDSVYHEFPSRGMLPTFLINSKSADKESWWRDTLPHLRQLVEEQHADIEIVLQYAEDIHFLPSGEFPPQNSIVGDLAFEDVVSMGSSIGIDGLPGGETFGGILTLKKDAQNLGLGITNSHVLEKGFSKDKEKTKIPFLSEQDASYKHVVSPADVDLQTAVRVIRDTVTEYENLIKNLKQAAEWLEEGTEEWKRKTDRMKSSEAKIKPLKDEISRIQNFVNSRETPESSKGEG